jgi:hypothetical protein
MTNRLFVLPTPDTLKTIQEAFQASAFEINWDQLGVEIGSSNEPIVIKPDAVYKATTGILDVWYEPATGVTSVILPLVPGWDMTKRHEEVGDLFFSNFVPNMLLVTPYSNSRPRKARLNSVATTWMETQPILTFYNELVVTDDSIYPAHRAFHEDYVATNQALSQFVLNALA